MLAHTYACAYKDTYTRTNYLFGRGSLINFCSAKSDMFTDAVCRGDRVFTSKRPPLASISSHNQQVQSSPEEWSYQLKAG